jgi:hypothetical protein
MNFIRRLFSFLAALSWALFLLVDHKFQIVLGEAVGNANGTYGEWYGFGLLFGLTVGDFGFNIYGLVYFWLYF